MTDPTYARETDVMLLRAASEAARVPLPTLRKWTYKGIVAHWLDGRGRVYVSLAEVKRARRAREGIPAA